MPKNRKSQAFSTRLKKETLIDYEEYKQRKEAKTGQEPGNSEALRDLAKIGLASEVGEGTPTERELRRDVQHLREEVDRLKEERDERAERLEEDKKDLTVYAVTGAIMVLGVAIVAISSYFTFNFGRIGATLLSIGAVAYALAPIMNRASWIP